MTHHTSPDETSNLLRLPDLPRGSSGRVVEVTGDSAFCQRMGELGLMEAVAVSVQHVNGSVLCKIKESRFGISRDAAKNVWVEPLN